MKKPFMGKITYEGVVEIPFSELLEDPRLVLRNLPRTESIELCGELDYKVTTTPFNLHNAVQIVGVGHVNLDVVDGEIIWSRSDHHCEETCNGLIEGTARDNGNGTTYITGVIGLIHPYITRSSWMFIKPMAQKLGQQALAEFQANFRDPIFENDVPE